MVTVDLLFNYGGEWIRSPHVLYSKNLLHSWKDYDPDHLSFIDIVNEFTGKFMYLGVQQLIISGPSGKFYEVEGDEGIRVLQSLVSEEFRVLNLFVVDEYELPVDVPNICQHNESFFSLANDIGTDCSEGEVESECEVEPDSPKDNSEELEVFAAQKNKDIDDSLQNYRLLYKGMSFKDIPEARRCLKFYAMANKKELKVIKSDKTRVRYECQEGCPFVCHISGDGDLPGVRIKTLNPKHDCNIAFDNVRVDYTTIGHYFKKKLQGCPKYRVKEMRDDLKRLFELNASKEKCKRAKRLVLETLEGSYNDGYNKIIAYANELKESNPGSDVVVNLSKDALAEGKRKFLRMYICFNALKMGFKLGLRPFIGLDGTFLKGRAKGQVLVAVGQDSMNHLYPIAWAIVDKETKRTWTWFMGLLQQSLGLQSGQGITFMSDMQKGLKEAIRGVLPDAHHRFCVRHVEANWCKRWRSFEFKKLLWWSAWSSFEEDFKDQLQKIGELSSAAASSLLNYPPQNWCRAYLDTVCKNQGVDNNFTESFNAWILDERYKPIIGMLEDIRVKVMTRLGELEGSVMKWNGDYSPYAIQLYNEYMKIAQACRVDYNGDNGFEVTDTSDKHTVNLVEKRCTCRTWDLTGIPCPHAIRALLYKKVDPKSEIHWFYTREAFLLTYKHKLQPVRGERFWKIDPSQAMAPPDYVNQASRPRVKRVREKDEAIKRQGEYSVSRKGRGMTCHNCGEPGHNARGCSKQAKAKQPIKARQNRKGKGKGKQQQPQEIERNRGLLDEDEVEDMDINSSAPQDSQYNDFVFMPTPTFQSQSSTSQVHDCQDADFENPIFEEEEDPDLRPNMISEEESLFEKRKEQEIAAARGLRRQIGFKGDKTGVSQPTNLPFSPPNLTWNGAAAITSMKLQQQSQQRRDKLKPMKGKNKC